MLREKSLFGIVGLMEGKASWISAESHLRDPGD
jgi:hypothetical protein